MTQAAGKVEIWRCCWYRPKDRLRLCHVVAVAGQGRLAEPPYERGRNMVIAHAPLHLMEVASDLMGKRLVDDIELVWQYQCY